MANVGRSCAQFSRKLLFNSLSNANNYARFSRQFSLSIKSSSVVNRFSNATGYVSFLPIGTSLFRHYGTEKIDTQKILENTFPQPKSDGSDSDKGSSKNEEEEERLKREASWRTMKISLIAIASSITFCGGYIIFSFGSPMQNEDGTFEEDEFSRLPIVTQYLKRTFKTMNFYTKMIKEPSRKKLLPEPLQYPYMQPPYTLVLELTDLLVHPEWTYSTGWRFKKRPGVDQFLEQVGPPLFEIVIYTAEQGMVAFPIINTLDPNGYIMYRLFRDATDYVDGHHVKNLDCLNRDLKRVIVVDWNPNSVKLHRANTFLVPRWTGSDSDTSLMDLAAFLKTIASNDVDDVRDVLVHYSQFDDPLETFKEKQRILMEEMEKEQEKKRVPTKFGWPSKSPFS
ncbi:Mitochondrial import inner membrane translocase subunit TIM50 [Homalodisca vitripennis]|nr:Mitochondrial import inner membrane translocase subunit TIM50 [Homalodisca vitripennis]